MALFGLVVAALGVAAASAVLFERVVAVAGNARPVVVFGWSTVVVGDEGVVAVVVVVVDG